MRIKRPRNEQQVIVLPQLHVGQWKAYVNLMSHRYMALRCGRRFGKTELGKAWLADGILEGEVCGWFAPQHKLSMEVFEELEQMLAPIVTSASRSAGVMRFETGARLDFWSLEKSSAGRSRGYQRIVIDEAAFAKDDDGSVAPMMEIWERSIKPTLHDRSGRALVCSNSAGKNPENFFYNICTESKYGFHEYHATTMDNPLLPMRLKGEVENAWQLRRAEELEKLKRDNAPLVFAQEYMAEFVDWSGQAFFDPEKLLLNGKPATFPTFCNKIIAVVDTASKTGTDNDATAVVYFAEGNFLRAPLFILDWDVVQIEGDLLVNWLPRVFERLDELAGICRTLHGVEVHIEDMNSGTVLLQHAKRHDHRVFAIESKLTSLGKDGRAISVSGYVHREQVKYTDYAFDKTVIYKGKALNHLVNQVESFRVGDKKSKREDDLLDCFCYGVAISLGNADGF